MSSAANDVLVMEHQAISTHSADKRLIYIWPVSNYYIYSKHHYKIISHYKKLQLCKG